MLLLASVLTCFAQFEQDKPSFKDRLFFGGGFGLTVGSVTHVDISPMVGYRITDRFSAGIGLSYQYYKYPAYNIKTSIYGYLSISHFHGF